MQQVACLAQPFDTIDVVHGGAIDFSGAKGDNVALVAGCGKVLYPSPRVGVGRVSEVDDSHCADDSPS
jgi:hypothetical protein